MKVQRHRLNSVSLATCLLVMASPAAHAGTSSWMAASSGYWDHVSNWTPSLPGIADRAQVIGPAISPDSTIVTVRNDAGTISSFAGADHQLVIGGGTLVVTGSFEQSGISGTTLDSGVLTLRGASQMSTFNMRGGQLGHTGNLTVNTLNWSGGVMGEEGMRGGSVTVNQAANFDGNKALEMVYGGSLNLLGTNTWSAGQGNLTVASFSQGPASFNIAKTGVFNDLGTLDPQRAKALNVYGQATFRNSGTFNRTGQGVTVIGSEFVNDGTVNITNGQLSIAGNYNSVNTGTINIGEQSVLAIERANFDVRQGAIRNDGRVVVNADWLLLSANAQLTGKGSVQIGASGGLSAKGMLSIQSLDIQGRFMNESTTIVSRLISNGTIESQSGLGAVDVSGSADFGCGSSVSAQLTLRGTNTWGACDNAAIYLSGGSFTIKQGASFSDLGTQTANGMARRLGNTAYSYSVIRNEGSFVREGTGRTEMSGQITNTGSIQVRGGELQLAGSLDNQGLIEVTKGATLSFKPGSWNNFAPFKLQSGKLVNDGLLATSQGLLHLLTGLSYEGVGSLRAEGGGTLRVSLNKRIEAASLEIAGGTMQFDDSAQAGNLRFENGTLEARQGLNLRSFQWTSGTIGDANNPASAVQVSGDTLIDGARTQQLSGGSSLTLEGKTTWTAGQGSLGSTYWSNGAGYITVSTNGRFVDQGTTSNAGVKRLDAHDGSFLVQGLYQREGSGITIMSGLNNQGVVRVAGGALQLEGANRSSGTIEIDQGSKISVSRGAYLEQNGHLNNAGSVDIDGNLNWGRGATHQGSGLWAIGAPGQLSIEAGATLHVDGAMANGGTIRLGNAARLELASLNFINQGLISGSGTLQVPGNMTNAGSISLNETGLQQALTIEGDLLLSNASTLLLDLSDGRMRNPLWVTGGLSLGGALSIQGPSSLQIGDFATFTVLTFDHLLSGAGLQQISWNAAKFQVETWTDEHSLKVKIQAVPEPSALALFALGLVAVAGITRKKKHACCNAS